MLALMPIGHMSLCSVSTTSTNAAQNNTFLDSSTNNFTITRNGNTTQGSFSPYGSLWSNYFDGSGDYLQSPSNSAFAFGTGDFTLECWIYATSTPSDMGIYEGRSTGSATDGFTLTAFSGSVIRIFSGGVLVASSGTSYVGQWVHVAVTRASGTTTLWINGVSQGTSSTSYNCTNTDAVVGGGRYSGGSSVNTYFPGYISNFRLVKGTASLHRCLHATIRATHRNQWHVAAHMPEQPLPRRQHEQLSRSRLLATAAVSRFKPIRIGRSGAYDGGQWWLCVF